MRLTNEDLKDSIRKHKKELCPTFSGKKRDELMNIVNKYKLKPVATGKEKRPSKKTAVSKAVDLAQKTLGANKGISNKEIKALTPAQIKSLAKKPAGKSRVDKAVELARDTLAKNTGKKKTLANTGPRPFKQVMNIEGVRQNIFKKKNEMVRGDPEFKRNQLKKIKEEFESDDMKMISGPQTDYKKGDYFFRSDSGDLYYIRILKRTAKGLEYIFGRVGGGNPDEFKDRLKMMEISREGDRKPKLTLYNRNLPDNHLRPSSLMVAKKK